VFVSHVLRRGSVQPVAEIVQCGLRSHNVLNCKQIDHLTKADPHNLLILLVLLAWLAALDDFRNWLIREAA
jgi:hypothetical protein